MYGIRESKHGEDGMKNNLYKVSIVLSVLIHSLLLSGCEWLSFNKDLDDAIRPNPISILDYNDWYGDDYNSGTYNYTKWIELDVWYSESISEYDWTDMAFDVVYEGEIIASEMPVVVEMNYMKCFFDASSKGAVTNYIGYLAPGEYEIVLKDGNNEQILSSQCNVTNKSGEALSDIILTMEQIDNQDHQVILRITFEKDITPYSKTGFYISVSYDNGNTTIVPENFSVETADTYMTIKYFDPDLDSKEVLLTVYCGDNSIVCSKLMNIT